jgi:hypothetical protein
MMDSIIDFLMMEIDESLARVIIIGGSLVVGWLIYKIVF